MNAECCVCYEDCNFNNFQIECLHYLCFFCYSKLVHKICPYCRQPLHITKFVKPVLKRNKFRRIGKINPNSYENKKLNTFLSYRHFCNVKHDIMKEQKFRLLKLLRVDCVD